MKRPLAGLVAALLVAFLALQKTRFGLAALFAAGILGYQQATTISSPTEVTRLLENRDRNVTLRAQVIIKGQHDSETPCTPEFLDAVRPEAVVQAVGVRPSSRYPDPGLRDRLAQRGIALYRTDDAGAVTIRLTQDGFDVRTFVGPTGDNT